MFYDPIRNSYSYYVTIITGVLSVYLYKHFYNVNKNIPKQIIYKHFTTEIKQHILRSRISAMYFMIVNLFTITLQLGIIYVACPDLFKLIGIMDKNDIDYEGYSNTIDYIISSTYEFTSIIISYIPIISHAVNLINALINITITLIGLYLFYKIFISIILKSIYDIFLNIKIVILGNDSDYAKLRKIERYAFRMYLLYKKKIIQSHYNNDKTPIENRNIIINSLLNGENLDENQIIILNEVEKLSDDIIKISLQNNYALKDKSFVENHLEIKTCIETLFNETKNNIRQIRNN